MEKRQHSLCRKKLQEMVKMRTACRKIFTAQRVNPEKDKENPQVPGMPFKYKLSERDIKVITQEMINESHSQNMGVISTIKGKMSCLKLGEVSAPKEFSHYFYSNVYRRRHESRLLRKSSTAPIQSKDKEENH